MMSDNIHPTIKFSRPSVEPLPVLLAETIRQAIQNGQLQPGERLPSEPEFANQLGVSRTTLRDAVRILINSGTLERRRGIGTFVSENPLINIQEGLETLLSTTDVIRQQGYEPGTAACTWETVPANELLAKALDVSPGSLVDHLSRTRTANGIPVIQSEEYLPTGILDTEKLKTELRDWSLYDSLKQKSLEIYTATCKINPIIADSRLASLLKVPQNHSLLLLRQTHYTIHNKPVLYCENFHNSSIIGFHIVRR